jgi:hypothetical protein
MHGPRRKTCSRRTAPRILSSLPSCLFFSLELRSQSKLAWYYEYCYYFGQWASIDANSKTPLAVMGSPYLLVAGDPTPRDEEMTKSLKCQLGHCCTVHLHGSVGSRLCLSTTGTSGEWGSCEQSPNLLVLMRHRSLPSHRGILSSIFQ